MKLTDAMIWAVRVKRRPKKLSDGRGLYLLVNPNGSRYWRLKYRYGGREKGISLGVYPEVSLSEARFACEQARALLRDGKDPSAERKAKKLSTRSQEWRAGDLYQSCAGHPVLCIDADEGDPHGGLYGISLLDGTEGHGCSKAACDPRKLTVKEVLKIRAQLSQSDLLVGIAEIAHSLRVTKNVIVNWRARYESFPKPIADLQMGPVWKWGSVKAWAVQHDIEIALKRAATLPTSAVELGAAWRNLRKPSNYGKGRTRY